MDRANQSSDEAPTEAPSDADDLLPTEFGVLAGRAAAQMSAENFPVALRVLPRGPREHLAKLYAYARFVDDVGDQADGDRLALLDLIEADVRRLGSGSPRIAPVRGLVDTVAATGMPLSVLLDLVEANRIDQRVSSYESFDDLLAYCQLSAAPIGRAVLYIAGAVTPANLADSDAVCAALQVLEHCQDVGEDHAAGRIYLPGRDLLAAGVSEAELDSTIASAALRGVVATQVERSLTLLAQGRPLVGRLRGWARFAVAGYVAGGLATARALRRHDFEVLAQAVHPSPAATAAAAAELLLVSVRRPWSGFR